MNQDDVAKNIEGLVAKYDAMKKRDKMDLSCDQDLTVAIMNLVGIEEHFFFTGAKTGKNEYFDLILEVRNMRKELLQRIIKDYEGEVWCISKHLLAASYRLMEVGTKQLDLGNKSEAYDFFTKAYKLYSLFWGLQMKLLPIDNIKKIDEQSLNQHDKEGNGVLGKLGVLVQKVINCCIE
ncbi:MAG: hypothetical protein ACD_21C00141G0002 [uncultured bacterium]|nr:MAG: hypothetical protein ACD_21C00141G0002 [uncultured bacterium]